MPQAMRRKLNRLSKRQLIDAIFSLKQDIEQIQRFFTMPIKVVSDSQLVAIQNRPGFISCECYALGRPAHREVGHDFNFRYVAKEER